jgi:hypothetical protein
MSRSAWLKASMRVQRSAGSKMGARVPANLSRWQTSGQPVTSGFAVFQTNFFIVTRNGHRSARFWDVPAVIVRFSLIRTLTTFSVKLLKKPHTYLLCGHVI